MDKMNLKEIYKNKTQKPIISFEVFPPKNDTDGSKFADLFKELDKLNRFNPSLISVTYGAGGSNQNQSLDIIKKIQNKLKTSPMPHFTCVSTNKANIKVWLETIEKLGIKNILALRGDIPQNGNMYDDFKHASELVAYIKANSNLTVAVAGYPETHKDAISEKDDLAYLKNKVDKGADVIYTQLFFNNDHFFSFIEKCNKLNINVPIIPGILPITSFSQLAKMAELSKVEIPQKLLEQLEAKKDDKEYIKNLGIEYATKQCESLLNKGINGIHFYTLNKAYSVTEILKQL